MRPGPEASNERGGGSSSEEGGGGGGRIMRRRRGRGMISAATAVLATSSASIRAAAAADAAAPVDESSDRSLRDHWGEESGNYEWSAEGETQAQRNSFRHDPIFDNDNAEPDDRMYAMAQSYSCATRQGARTCSDDDDCRDEYGQYGGDSNCGFAFCQSDTGTCMYNAWRSGEGCESTFRTCREDWGENGRSNHGVCDRGPSGVRGVEGLCIGWSRNECVYAWCPPSSSATATVVSAMGDDVLEAPPAPPAATTTTPPPPEEDPPVDEIREYECTVDLIGSPRPLYGELEMERLIASLSTCTTKVHPLAVVESVEVMGQEYVPGQDGDGGDVYGGRERRSARRRLGKKRRTRAKAKHRYCKRCRNNDPASDRRRHLEHEETTTTALTFDDCMLSLLLAGVTHDREELGALWGVDEVETVCAEAAQQQDPNAPPGTTPMPLGDHTIVHTHDDGTGTANQDPSAGGRSVDDDDEEVFCETTFTGPDVVPMLSQRELLYFDWCFLKVYNRLHYDPTDPDNSEMMIGSVVLEQDPDFAVVDNPLYADGDAIRRGRKLAGKRSRTKSSVRRCKRCNRGKKDELPGADRQRQRRRRNDDSSGRQLASPPDWTKFSPLLAKCLHEGRDPERPDRPYPAFASRLLVTDTTCDPTAAEISAQAATAEAEAALQAKRIDAERAFEEGQKREAESFREYCAAEEAKFRRELEEKKRTFALKQETDRLEFLADWEAKEKQREGV